MRYMTWFFLIILCCTQAIANENRTLRFYNWNDYMVSEVLTDFSKETGIKIETPIYTSMDEMLKALKSGESFDVVVPSHFMLPGLIDEGLLQPLNKKKLPNLIYADGRLMVKLSPFDPQHHYAAPYLWGTIGIAVNRPLAEAALGGRLTPSWDLLFDPKLSRRLTGCGMSALDAPNEMLAILLNYKGLNLKRSSPRRIRQAAEALNALRSSLRYVDEERYIQDLAAGKLCVAVSLVGNALRAREAGQPVDFFIPKEGSVMFLDALAIPANAANPQLAHEFINYLMRPEVAARLTEGLFYANTNTESVKFLAPELAQNPAIYPDANTLRHLFLLETLSEQQEAARDEIWPRFVKGAVQ